MQAVEASGTTIAADLRRRRDAALRCPPLEDGRRDPLDTPRQYSRAEVESAAEHFEGLGQLDEFMSELLRRQWSVAS